MLATQRTSSRCTAGRMPQVQTTVQHSLHRLKPAEGPAAVLTREHAVAMSRLVYDMMLHHQPRL